MLKLCSYWWKWALYKDGMFNSSQLTWKHLKRNSGEDNRNHDFGCIMCGNHRQKRAMLPLRTKPSYYIVLGHSPVIPDLMQVEILAIISPADTGGDIGLSFHCVKRSMGVALSIAEGLGQDVMCCCLQSLTQQPSHHPFVPHNTPSIFSAPFPISIQKLISLSLSSSCAWAITSYWILRVCFSDSGRYEEVAPQQ